MADQPDLFTTSTGPESLPGSEPSAESEPSTKDVSIDDQTDTEVEQVSRSVNVNHDVNDQSITDKFNQVNSRHKLFNALGRGLLAAVVLLLLALMFRPDDDQAGLLVEREGSFVEEVLDGGRLAESTILIAEQPLTPQNEAKTNVADTVAKASKRILLYSGPNERGTVISTVKSALNLDVKNPGVVWTEVTSINGIPVWISRKNAKLYGTGYTIVTRDNIKAYSKPQASDSFLYGRLPEGEVSRLILKNKEWFRVIAPRSFTAWVKTSDLSI